jgi:hypothetical protein
MGCKVPSRASPCEEQQSPAIDRRLTRDEARRMAVNFANLPRLLAQSPIDECPFHE